MMRDRIALFSAATSCPGRFRAVPARPRPRPKASRTRPACKREPRLGFMLRSLAAFRPASGRWRPANAGAWPQARGGASPAAGRGRRGFSRELGLPLYKLDHWRQKAEAALDGALKERETDGATGELATAMQRIGELSMEVELLRSRIERPGPLARRRSR